MRTRVQAGYDAPGFSFVDTLQYASDLDRRIDGIDLPGIECDVFHMGQVGSTWEGQILDTGHLAQPGKFGPAQTQVVTVREMGRLGARIKPGTSGGMVYWEPQEAFSRTKEYTPWAVPTNNRSSGVSPTVIVYPPGDKQTGMDHLPYLHLVKVSILREVLSFG
jgi:hypothetical protein